MKFMLSVRKRRYLAIVSVFLITAALIALVAGCEGESEGEGEYWNPTIPPSQNLEIRTWHDLNAIRDNPAGNHTLMNDLDSTTAGYEELASPTSNGGKGWEPIATYVPEGGFVGFMGTFEGQGCEIRDLFINRPDENAVGLFRSILSAGAYEQHGEGVVRDIGVVYATVTGHAYVGGLVGENEGTVSNSYSTGSVTGNSGGGLVGSNHGTVSNSHSTSNVTADRGRVGGLVGHNWKDGTVTNSYATGSVTGEEREGAGGLVGDNWGTVSGSYATGRVTGDLCVGGLLGENHYCTVSDSYSTGSVNGTAIIGGLIGWNEEGAVSNSYSDSNVTGIGGLGGLVGVSHKSTVGNSYSTGSVAGEAEVGGLVGENWASTVSNSYATGSVNGTEGIGGLVGAHNGTISDSYATGSVSGLTDVGGLVGMNYGTVSNSFWDIETSGQATSDGGTGKTTAEMQDIATFSGASWNIFVVADSGIRNPSYIWNIVDAETYPFLSWQP